MNGSASSVSGLKKTVSAVAVMDVVFHVVNDGNSVVDAASPEVM